MRRIRTFSTRFSIVQVQVNGSIVSQEEMIISIEKKHGLIWYGPLFQKHVDGLPCALNLALIYFRNLEPRNIHNYTTMVTFSKDLRLLIQLGTLGAFCCQESSAFNLQSSRRAHLLRTERNTIRTPVYAPAKSIRELHLQATTLSTGSNSEEKRQSSQTYAASDLTANETADGASWDHIIAPSSVVTPDHSKITTLDRIGIVVFTVTAISSVLGLVWNSSGSWRFFMAGGICAAVSHTIPTPIDVIKVSQTRNASSILQ